MLECVRSILPPTLLIWDPKKDNNTPLLKLPNDKGQEISSSKNAEPQ
jgi:hypothetical protein